MSSCHIEQAKEATTLAPVDMVYPQLDTENSRWFFFSSACRPFGMVNLSPDTQLAGEWGSGYRYNTDTIKGFSHIHEWQLSGLSVMPVTIVEKNTSALFSDFSSAFSHEKEVINPGYHYVELERYKIAAEITSTKRVGFHKYQFPENCSAAILFNLNTLLGPCKNTEGELYKIDESKIAGHLLLEPTIRRPKYTKLFFQVEFNQPLDSIIRDEKTKNYIITFTETETLLMKAGISYTSIENASANIEAELPHWDFERVVKESKDEWNSLLSRIKIEGGTTDDQRRFYTDLWHALQGRRIISDVNGAYPDNTGEAFRIGQIRLNENGKPKFNHHNSDSFWGAQWTINTLWGLVYPEIYEDFVHSLMQYYSDGGLIPRGPSGGNYTYVMTGAPTTPFIVSAIQKGIVTENLEEIYVAIKKNHMPGGIMGKSGYEHKTCIGGGLEHYIKNGYVPYPIPEGDFGFHQDGASLTMEYAYQDWTLAQLAKKLGKESDYQYFVKRSENFKNVYDSASTWMRPKDINGVWRNDFDPYIWEHGFNESNAAQSTWFVPHNLQGLANLMGGNEAAVNKLIQQFETASELGFTAGNSHDRETHSDYQRIPINYGNQPSIQTAHVFNHLGRPDLTQYWSRQVVQGAFSGLSPSTGYNGDEDQGLMGSLAVLLKIGLFQMNGGTDEEASYELGSPIFDKITIALNREYYQGDSLVIEASKNDVGNCYINNVLFNNLPLKGITLNHKEIVKGGKLKLEMTNLPKKQDSTTQFITTE
jgi:predicted alpha-1,2-mannosidase